MNNYLILTLKSDATNKEAVEAEIQQTVAMLRLMQAECVHEHVVEKFGAEVAQWLFSTNLNTLRTEFALTPEGKLLLGLYGDPLF